LYRHACVDTGDAHLGSSALAGRLASKNAIAAVISATGAVRLMVHLIPFADEITRVEARPDALEASPCP
jgi:hypothetical protein